MASIYSFESLVNRAYQTLQANPANLDQARQTLRQESSPNWFTQLLFFLNPFTSIDSRIEKAIETAKHAITGFAARLEYNRTQNGLELNPRFSERFEAFSNARELHPESTPAKMGRCWAEYIKEQDKEFAPKLSQLARSARWRAERERPQSIEDELEHLKRSGDALIDYPRDLFKRIFPRLWAEVVREFPNEATAEAELNTFLANPRNANLNFYKKIQHFFAHKLKTKMTDLGFPDPKIREILQTSLDSFAAAPHPVRAAVRSVEMNLPAYQLDLEAEKLPQDQDLLNPAQRAEQCLAAFQQRYPQLWQQAILPRFNDDEDAASEALKQIIAATNSRIDAFAEYVACFKKLADSDPPTDLSNEQTQLKSFGQFQTTEGLPAFLKTAFPRIWAQIAPGFENDQAAAAFIAWAALPANASLTCYQKIGAFLSLRLQERMLQMGHLPQRIEAIFAEAAQGTQTYVHPTFAALARINEELPVYNLELEMRRLKTDNSFEARNKSAAELLQNFKTTYPGLWEKLVLPNFSRAESAEMAYQSFLGDSRPDGEGLLYAVMSTYRNAVKKRLEQKQFSPNDIDAIFSAAQTQMQGSEFPLHSALRLVEKHFDRLSPAPKPVEDVFAPLRGDPMFPRILAALNLPDDQIAPDVIEATFNLSEELKKQGTKLSPFFTNPFLSAHLDPQIRTCLQRRERIREIGALYLQAQFYQSMRNRNATLAEEELLLDPSQILPTADGIPNYKRLVEDLHRAPTVQFNGKSYRLSNHDQFNQFLKALKKSLIRTRKFNLREIENALLAVQLFLCRDYSTKFSDVFAQPWAEQPYGGTLATGKMDFIEIQFHPDPKQNERTVQFSLSYVGTIQISDPEKIDAPPIASEEVVVTFGFTRSGDNWIRSEPIWDLVSDPQIREDDGSDLKPISEEEEDRAEEMERLLEDPAVNRKLGEAAADPDQTKTTPPSHSAESGIVIEE